MSYRSGLLAALTLAVALPAFADDSLNALLPQEVRDAGVLRVVGTTNGTPPMLYTGEDGQAILGLEAELTNALGEVLGLTVEYTPATFDSLIPAIAAGRADLAVGSIGDLKVRQEQVDFVDYVTAGAAMAVRADDTRGIVDMAGLCGAVVAVQRGTFQEGELAEQKEKCEAAGSTLEAHTFSDANASLMALRTERVDVWLGDSAPVGYAVAQSGGELKMAGPVRALCVLGYALGKDNEALVNAVKAGLDELVANGTYKAIFEKWGQEDTMLEKITINDAWL